MKLPKGLKIEWVDAKKNPPVFRLKMSRAFRVKFAWKLIREYIPLRWYQYPLAWYVVLKIALQMGGDPDE